MKFCPACRNMLYPIDESVVDGTKTAVFSCNKCDFKQKIDDANPLVYEHILREDKASHLATNEYLEYDPTLEHLTTLVCPNTECPSKSGAKPDVVAVKTNVSKLIWLYKCANCKTAWEQSSRVE
jgi:DNA-directed RNA polymerase subunit M/transcription elongation factor TFIIS